MPEPWAVGLANQGESCLGWDARTGAPVGPVIVWQDMRTSDVTAKLATDGHGRHGASPRGPAA